MPTQIQTIIRRATKPENEPLNILTWATHERTQEKWAKTGHNFYMWQGEGLKPWVDKYAPVPPGHFLLDGSKGPRQLPDYVDLDLVFAQNKDANWQIAEQISRQIKIPIVNVTHTLPPPNWNKIHLHMNKEMRADVEVFITDYSREVWGYSREEAIVINHGVDTEIFKPYEPDTGLTESMNEDGLLREDWLLVVANDYINRDWCLGFRIFAEITGWPHAQMVKFKALGDTEGFSRAATSTSELIGHFQKCGVFLNTSTVSPMPTSLLEAASCGCPIVSTNNCAIPELITHGENGFLSNDPAQMREYCRLLINDKKLAKEMGDKARQTILEKFTLERFVKEWDELFNGIAQ